MEQISVPTAIPADASPCDVQSVVLSPGGHSCEHYRSSSLVTGGLGRSTDAASRPKRANHCSVGWPPIKWPITSRRPRAAPCRPRRSIDPGQAQLATAGRRAVADGPAGHHPPRTITLSTRNQRQFWRHSHTRVPERNRKPDISVSHDYRRGFAKHHAFPHGRSSVRLEGCATKCNMNYITGLFLS